MPSPLLLSLGLSALFSALGITRRWLISRTFEWKEFIGTLLTSFAVGFAFGQLAIPGLYLAFSFAFRHGPIEQNLYPGQSLDLVINYFVLSIIIASAWAIVSWWAQVNKGKK